MTRITALSTLFMSVTLFGCGNDEKILEGEDVRLDGPPAASPFAEAKDPDKLTEHPTLDRPVEVIRDEYGVPHVYGANRDDVSYAYGYLHAKDRLFIMDAFRHLGTGTISEYIGMVGLAFDKQFRPTFMLPDGRNVADAIVEDLPEDILKVLQAYSDGVNAYLAELRAGEHVLPPSYGTPLLAAVTPDDIPDWKPRDVMAVARVEEWQLTSGAGGGDIAIGELVTKLPADLFADVVRFAPVDKTVVVPDWFKSEKSAEVDLRDAKAVAAERRAQYRRAQGLYRGIDFAAVKRNQIDLFGNDDGKEHFGSNNWVVSGEHTKSGFPIVANDPHLSFIVPSLFHHVHLDTKLYGPADRGFSTMGISVPGISGIVIGQTEKVAWGATVAGWDVTDVYVETLNAKGDAVMFNGKEVKIERFKQKYTVGLGDDAEVVEDVVEYVPHHGPITPGSKKDGKALTVKWTGRMMDQEVLAVLGTNTATDIGSWKKSLEDMAVLAQSWNGADVDGGRAYFPHAWIPIRKKVTGECAPYKPMDGTGPCEWDGILPPDKVPQVADSKSGWLVTANNDIAGNLIDNDPTNDPQYLLDSRAVGFRAGRITQAIEKMIADGKKITLEDMVELQADTHSLEGERMVPMLLKAADDNPTAVSDLGLGDAVERLRSWDFTTPSGVDAEYRKDKGPDAKEIEASVAASIFYAWVTRFRNNVLDDDLAVHDAGIGTSAKVRAIFYLLENESDSKTGATLFDDVTTTEVVETKEDIMLASLKQALDWLASGDAFDTTDMEAWRWGQLHGMQTQDLFGAFAGAAFITQGPFPRGGASYTVDVAGFGSSGTNFNYGAGPQMRYVAELDPDGIRAVNALPGGQSDDTDSPHYDDLLQMWLRNETFPYYFKSSDVAKHIEEYMVFTPKPPAKK